MQINLAEFESLTPENKQVKIQFVLKQLMVHPETVEEYFKQYCDPADRQELQDFLAFVQATYEEISLNKDSSLWKQVKCLFSHGQGPEHWHVVKAFFIVLQVSVHVV